MLAAQCRSKTLCYAFTQPEIYFTLLEISAENSGLTFGHNSSLSINHVLLILLNLFSWFLYNSRLSSLLLNVLCCCQMLVHCELLSVDWCYSHKLNCRHLVVLISLLLIKISQNTTVCQSFFRVLISQRSVSIRKFIFYYHCLQISFNVLTTASFGALFDLFLN